MFSLSLRERILVAAVLTALVLGITVKHWRDSHRESRAILPPAAATSSADPASHPSVVQSQVGQLHP